MTDQFTTNPLFERVERARRRKHKIRETHITLAHGSGGRAMNDLVEGLFLEYFKNPLLEKLEDQAVFEIPNGAKRLHYRRSQSRAAGNCFDDDRFRRHAHCRYAGGRAAAAHLLIYRIRKTILKIINSVCNKCQRYIFLYFGFDSDRKMLCQIGLILLKKLSRA